MIPSPDDSENLQKNPARNWFVFNVHPRLSIKAAHDPMSDCIQTAGYHQIQANRIGYIKNGSGSEKMSVAR
jgi:hypothetical protein